MRTEDIIIIGGGPAGIAAAIQLKRQRYNPLLFEKDSLGGILKNANLIENYPGFPGGISGRELVGLFTDQYKQHSVKTIYEEVIELNYQNDCFIARTDNHTVHASFAIIASGTIPKIPDELKPYTGLGNRILFTVYPLLDIKDKAIVIIGSGDIAFDYALSLHKANDVTILNRGAHIKCLALLHNRVKQSARIKYFDNTEIVNVTMIDGKRLEIECNSGHKMTADYILGAVGREASIGFLSENLIHHKTELEKDDRLYFIGDCKGSIFRQTAIAVGDAVLAAMRIDRKLKRETGQ